MSRRRVFERRMALDLIRGVDSDWREDNPSTDSSEAGDAAVQIVLVGTLDSRGDDLADAQRPPA